MISFLDQTHSNPSKPLMPATKQPPLLPPDQNDPKKEQLLTPAPRASPTRMSGVLRQGSSSVFGKLSASSASIGIHRADRLPSIRSSDPSRGVFSGRKQKKTTQPVMSSGTLQLQNQNQSTGRYPGFPNGTAKRPRLKLNGCTTVGNNSHGSWQTTGPHWNSATC